MSSLSEFFEDKEKILNVIQDVTINLKDPNLSYEEWKTQGLEGTPKGKFRNPKLRIYIDMRFDNFKEILVNGYIKNEIRLRNNNKIRKLFAEMGTILCCSRKKHSLNPIKVSKDEYQITNMKNNLKAQKILYANGIFRKEDPKELFIAMNELGFHL